MNEDMMTASKGSSAQSAGCDADAAETQKETTNGWLEGIYDNFSGVPIKCLDIFIAVCMIALVLVILVGVLKAKGML